MGRHQALEHEIGNLGVLLGELLALLLNRLKEVGQVIYHAPGLALDGESSGRLSYKTPFFDRFSDGERYGKRQDHQEEGTRDPSAGSP